MGGLRSSAPNIENGAVLRSSQRKIEDMGFFNDEGFFNDGEFFEEPPSSKEDAPEGFQAGVRFKPNPVGRGTET